MFVYRDTLYVCMLALSMNLPGNVHTYELKLLVLEQLCVCVVRRTVGNFLVPVVIIISVCLDVSVHCLTVHSASKAIYVWGCGCAWMFVFRGTEARCDVPVH